MARRLGVSADYVFAAYEDVFYYLLRERKLPANVDPLNSQLADPLERARLTRVFGGELGDPIGYVLPLARPIDGAAWQSSRWYLRSERCYLIPGDSPIGYRLPLDSLPAVSPSDFPHIHPPDPTQNFDELAPHGELLEKRAGRHRRRSTPRIVGRRRADRSHQNVAVRAAAQRRALRLHAADAHARGLPADRRRGRGEREDAWPTGDSGGLRTAADPRLVNFKVTPDPGVIEVNVQPSASWDELSALTTHLYDTARECGLRSEKFMIDGRHVGTGGGNHIVMGGATPQDSPFLRRPDLLRSLISYWHNHPSLSYLFSGLFIGPTRRRREWTKRATIRCTSLRSHSSNSPRQESRRRPG